MNFSKVNKQAKLYCYYISNSCYQNSVMQCDMIYKVMNRRLNVKIFQQNPFVIGENMCLEICC